MNSILRDSLFEFFREFYPGRVDTVCKVARMLIEYHADGRKLNRAQFIRDTGLPSKSVHRALNHSDYDPNYGYGLERLFFGSMPSSCQIGTINTNTHDQSDTTQTPRGKTLLSVKEIISNMISLVALPRLKIELGVDTADVLLIGTLRQTNEVRLDAKSGMSEASEAVVAQAINDRLGEVASSVELALISKLNLRLGQWYERFSDPKLTLDGDWQDGYTDFVIEKHLTETEGKPMSMTARERETGVPRSTLARKAKPHWEFEPVFGKPFTIDRVEDMPPLKVIPGKGYPRKMAIVHEDERYIDLDYTRAANRAQGRKAIEDGGYIIITPQTASIARRKTAKQMQVEVTKEILSAPRIKRPRKPANLATVKKSTPAHVCIGYSEDKARQIAIAICYRLGDDKLLPVSLETLKSSELVQVMLGKAYEVGKMYTTSKQFEDIARVKKVTTSTNNPAIADKGVFLFNAWQSFSNPDKRDDWYSALGSDDKLALIDYRAELWKQARSNISIAA